MTPHARASRLFLRIDRPSRILAIALLGVGVVGACGDSAAPVSPELLGTYQLVSVNGTPLPVTIIEGSVSRLDVLQGTILLREDRTFSRVTTLQGSRVDGSEVFPPENDLENGSYSLSGSTITFHEDWGPGLGVQEIGAGSVTATTLLYNERFSEPANVYRYERQ